MTFSLNGGQVLLAGEPLDLLGPAPVWIVPHPRMKTLGICKGCGTCWWDPRPLHWEPRTMRCRDKRGCKHRRATVLALRRCQARTGAQGSQCEKRLRPTHKLHVAYGGGASWNN